jgi:hypothetical protein
MPKLSVAVFIRNVEDLQFTGQSMCGMPNYPSRVKKI